MFEWMLQSVRQMFRERDSLFFALLFPIILVALLGNMLAELDNPESDSPLGAIRIACYVEEGQRADEAAAVEAFTSALVDYDGIEIVKVESITAVRAEVDGGGADAALIFEKPLNIATYEGEDLYKNRAVMLMAQSFAREYAAYKVAALKAPEAFAQASAEGGEQWIGAELVADKDLGVKRSMIDFYAVTTIVMIAFMGGGIGGASATFFARQNGSLRRATASPRSRSRLFLESVVGTIPQNIMQAGIVMLVSTVFFDAHYAKTWPENLLLFAFFVLLGIAISAVFMLFGLFIKVNPYLPLLAVLWALLFMSGTFSKGIYIEGFSEYLPMAIVQKAAFDLTLFGRPNQVLLVMVVCGLVLLVSCILGSILFRRKGIML